MRSSLTCLYVVVAASLTFASANSAWSFEDASVSVQGKGAGIDGGSKKERFTPGAPLSAALSLGASDTLKVILTTTEDKEAKRPHQAFLTLRDPSTGLEDSYVFSVKESGKGKVEVAQKDLPIQLLTSEKPLKASLVIASFGSSTPLNTAVFDVNIKRDQSASFTIPEKPLRYGKLEEIHHTFRSDPKSPPKIISLIFTAAVLATLPVLVGIWLSLGANVNHLSEALGSAPLSHAIFVGSIIALEGIFFMYYKSWNLFQMLPAAGTIGLLAFLSGSRALSEVQGRRLAGKR